MSDTNFMSYTDAQSVLGGFANAIKGKDDPYTTISYADWLNLTDQEKESGKYYITGAPGADGSIQVDLITKLWENPDTSQSFTPQNITLSSGDYDMLMVEYRYSTSYNYKASSTFVGRGYLGLAASSSGGAVGIYRQVSTVDATHISVSNANISIGAQAETVLNNYCIPATVYGIKTTQTIRINAIASDVSTSADKCMLSDGVTSVNKALTNPDKVECQVGSLYTNKITIDNNSSYRIGNLIIVNVRFTITGSNVPSSSALFSGFPIPKTTLSSNLNAVALATNRVEYSFALSTSGEVTESVAAASLPTQMYLISGSYIAED